MLDDAESAFLLRLSLLLTPGLAELKTFKQLVFFFFTSDSSSSDLNGKF